MSKMHLNGSIKIPRAKGRAFVQVLKKNSAGDFVPDGPEREETNVVLDQAMAMYGAVFDIGADDDAFSSQIASVQVGGSDLNRSLCYLLYVSDDTDPASASTTVKKGTTYGVGSLTRAVEDAGEISGTEYTRAIIEGILYNTSIANYSLSKIYVGSTGLASQLSPRLDYGDPVTELLLASPIPIINGEETAVKIRYEVLWPRMGTYANNDQGTVVCGTGTLAVQKRDLSDAVTAGPNVNWTMKYAGNRYGNSNAIQDAETFAKITTPAVQTVAGVPGYTKYATSVGGAVGTNIGRESASCAVSYPTAKSVQLDFEQVVSRRGGVGTTWNLGGLMMLWTTPTSNWGNSNTGGSPWWVEFDAFLNVDWTETLEVHATLTIDWS